MIESEISRNIKENIGKLAGSFHDLYNSWDPEKINISLAKAQDLEYIISQIRIAMWCLETGRLEAAEYPLKEIAWPGEYIAPASEIKSSETKPKRLYRSRKKKTIIKTKRKKK